MCVEGERGVTPVDGDDWIFDNTIGAVAAAAAVLAATQAATELSSGVLNYAPVTLTTAQRDLLTARDGMLIYNSTTKTHQARQNGAWVTLVTA